MNHDHVMNGVASDGLRLRETESEIIAGRVSPKDPIRDFSIPTQDSHKL